MQKINRALYYNTKKNMINNKFLRLIAEIFIKAIGKNAIRKICYKNMMKYSCESSNYWFSCFGGLYEGNIHPKEYYSTPIYLQFEDIKAPVPKEYDKLLTKTYGNYMKLPKPKDRKVQHCLYLDLTKPYKEYIKEQKEGEK